MINLCQSLLSRTFHLRKFKQQLRSHLSPSDRANVMENYLRHLMLQWQDREADLRWASLSVQLTVSMRFLPETMLLGFLHLLGICARKFCLGMVAFFDLKSPCMPPSLTRLLPLLL